MRDFQDILVSEKKVYKSIMPQWFYILNKSSYMPPYVFTPFPIPLRIHDSLLQSFSCNIHLIKPQPQMIL